MANESSTTSSGGVTSGTLLFLLFLGLKLAHVIDWSWWWVTAPLWIGTALALLIICIVGIFVGLGKR